ncbi:MAG TPA: glycosyltransferase family 4 protein [Terriglobia bacterium]|nr:glycosyltransferase family 4 protein [Terriglobia bacterium]
MVLGLFGHLVEPGGVERVNRLAGAVLAGLAEAHHEECELLSLNDPPGEIAFEVGGRRYTGAAFGRQKARLVARALRLAPRARLAYLGHPNFAPLGALLKIVNPRLRYWVVSHGAEVWEPLPRLSRRALRRAEGVTAPSRFTLDHLIRTQGLDPARAALVPHGLDPSFAGTAGCGASAQSPAVPGLMLTVARLRRLEKGKGIDTVIQSLPKVLQSVPHASLVVVGDGDHRTLLEALAARLGVREKVRFVGHVDEHALKEFYRQAELFVMPSRQEGFGLVFLEAMAFGKPAVGGNFGGIPEIVVEGVTGYVVEYGNVEALADRLTCLLTNESLRRRMGAAGKQRVIENYGFEVFQKRLIALLDGGPRAAAG